MNHFDAIFKGGYTLTTAEILYRMPDHPALLQSFVWQDYDRMPDFPELLRFLKFWVRELDGPLHSVKVASADPSKRPLFLMPEFVATVH